MAIYNYYLCITVGGKTDCTDSEPITIGGMFPDLSVAHNIEQTAIYLLPGVASQQFNLAFSAINNGGAATGDLGIYGFYYNMGDDPSIDTGTLIGSTNVLPALTPGAESSVLTIPSMVTTKATDGTYYYGVCVSLAADENSNNDCVVIQKVVVGGRPDTAMQNAKATISSGDPAVVPGPTGTFKFTVEVTNHNDFRVAAGTIVNIYSSTDATFNTAADGTEVTTIATTGDLGEGETEVLTAASLAAPTVVGTHYYFACVKVTGDTTTDNDCTTDGTMEGDDMEGDDMEGEGMEGEGMEGEGMEGEDAKESENVRVEVRQKALAVAAGLNFSCATNQAKELWCWGRNSDGQLGIGSSEISANKKIPVKVDNSDNAGDVTAFSAGTEHTCAVVSGAAWCWGNNGEGQLGVNTASTADILTPMRVKKNDDTEFSGVTAIAAGHHHTCAVVNGGGTSGTAWCWGDNSSGRLGDGTISTPGDPLKRPDPIPAVDNDRQGAVQVVDTAGSGTLSGVTAIAAARHTCAVVSGGAWCWGLNKRGQLGDGTDTDRKTPQQVKGEGGSGTLSGVTAISVSEGRDGAESPALSCAIASGAAWCWGSDQHGAVGNGHQGPEAHPQKVLDSGGNHLSGVISLSTGLSFGCAVLSDGSVQCWGGNLSGSLGDGQRTILKTTTVDGVDHRSHVAQQVTGMTSGVSAVYAGGKHACALQNGFMQCWGGNHTADLGDGTEGNARLTPVLSLFHPAE